MTMTIARARNIVHTPQPDPTDDAIIRQDRNVRSNLAFATHQIAYQLKMRDELLEEHKRLTALMQERNLPLPKEGPSFL